MQDVGRLPSRKILQDFLLCNATAEHPASIQFIEVTNLSVSSRTFITLLVDDDAIQACTRKTILEHAGQKVAVAGNGIEALSMLEHADILHRVGLVITDHLMPGMNGPELVSGLRLVLPSTPILILSGLPDAEEEYQGMGIVFRSKPFPPDALIALTRQLLRQPMSRTA